ncbi:hypothetical protein ACQP2K_35060 [Microbispora siamensis]
MTTDLNEDAAKALDVRTVRPPGWLLLGTTTFVALISCYLASVPYQYLEGFVFMFLAWSVLGIIWTIRLILAGWTNRRRPMTTHWWVTAIRWLLVPLIFVGVVLAIEADAPFQVRFKLSQSSLERYAETLAHSGRSVGCQWVGLYYVCGEYPADGFVVSGGAEAIPGGAQVMVTDWPLMVSRGFLWLPDGRQPPDDTWCEEYEHLAGPWWGCRSWDGW